MQLFRFFFLSLVGADNYGVFTFKGTPKERIQFAAQWLKAHRQPYKKFVHGSFWRSVPDRNCKPASTFDPKEANLVLLPTPPRAANTFIRKVWEKTTGLATGNVWNKQEGSHPCPGQNITTPYFEDQCRCGITRSCSHVHFPTEKEPFLVKSHYPAKVDGRKVLGEFKSRGKRVAWSSILMSIRNPIDNHLGYYRAMFKEHDQPPRAVVYLSHWIDHFAFWFNYSLANCVPLTVVRFEDLTLPRVNREVYTELLRGAGLDVSKYNNTVKKMLPQTTSITEARRRKDDVYNNVSVAARYDPWYSTTELADEMEMAAELMDQLGYRHIVEFLKSRQRRNMTGARG